MATETFTSIGTFIIEHCCNCGMAFAVSNDFYERRRNDHNIFYCPAGHPQHYTGKSEAEKLRDEIRYRDGRIADLQASRFALHDQLIRQKNITRSEKAAKTRIKNRVSHGICPCCNRTFKQLANHMKSKHPDFVGNIEKPNSLHQKISNKKK